MIHTYPPKEGENDTYLSSEGGRVWYIPICEMRVGKEIPYLTPHTWRPQVGYGNTYRRGEVRYLHTHLTHR